MTNPTTLADLLEQQQARLIAQAVEEATAGLRAALGRYGRHEDGCHMAIRSRVIVHWSDCTCTCGLSAALEAK